LALSKRRSFEGFSIIFDVMNALNAMKKAT